MEIEELNKQYPSKCYSCSNSRKTWSLELMEEGYVGCKMIMDFDIHGIIDDLEKIDEQVLDSISAESIATGWVDLHTPISNTELSGKYTNFQLITKCTRNCRYYNTDIINEYFRFRSKHTD